MALIETIIALALTYALLSLVASAFKEMLESLVQKRKKDFKAAIEGLLGVFGSQAFLQDARIQAINAVTKIETPLFRAKSTVVASADSGKKSDWPSYIESNTFAAVTMDLLSKKLLSGPNAQTPNKSKLEEAVQALAPVPNQQITLIEQVYNERMARVEGSFKRNAQYWLLGIGFCIAVATDADTLNIGRNLQIDSAGRAALVKLAETVQKEEDLEKLCKPNPAPEPAVKNGKEASGGKASAPTAKASAPAAAAPASAPTLLRCIKEQAPSVIGWSAARKSQLLWEPLEIIQALFGYLLTAIAISLGAPFWFDVIGKVSNIRSTLKPKEKT